MENRLKQRNGCISFWLWLAIIINMALVVYYALSMFSADSSEIALGLGLCSIFGVVNVLSAILLLRWNKIGFYMMVVSSIMAIVVNICVLKREPMAMVGSLSAIVIWWAILQMKKNGVSAWSQLQSGWDGKHCRHLYQLFAGVELVLFILTLIAFGEITTPFPEPVPLLSENVLLNKQNLDGSVSRDSVKVSDSIQTESHTTKTSNYKSEKIEAEKRKPSTDKMNPKKSSNKSYSLEDAVKYLDTHDVWFVHEMNQYPDLHNLRELMRSSLSGTHETLPHSLVSKSKILRRIWVLLREIDHIIINSPDERILRSQKVRTLIGITSDKINPYKIIESLENTLIKARSYERRSKSNIKLSDDKQVKSQSSVGDSVNGKDAKDSQPGR